MRLLQLLRSVAFSCPAFLLAWTVNAADLHLEKIPGAKPRNIIFILTDDQRYDALGFMNHPFLQTPNMDSLAKNGVHARNAFVTTSLCSPSRASILTGVYAHTHQVVDNNNPIPTNTIFFSQYLQAAGYDTAFIGKWHMGGEGDQPEPGWSHWVSFRGQGSYWPTKSGLNVDGKHVPQKGYITDELTDYAMDWLRSRKGDKPFMLYLSHKAVHAGFIPADRYKGRYKDQPVKPPITEADTPENYAGKPMWVRNQRNSWHGVDFPYHSDLDIAQYYRDYCETLLAVDDSLGRILDFLREKHLFDSTLVVFMGDNGFMFGEHGLIDKRTAYEASIRVPLLIQCPELFKAGTVLNKMVANIDIAPTFLEAAGLKAPAYMDGKSFISVAQGKDVPWRTSLLYEYYWERNYPQTPTMHALRTEQYKYIHYYGIWDTDELYDIKNDPNEMKNLIRLPAYQKIVKRMNREMFAQLKATGGMYIPLHADRGNPNNLRRIGGSKAATFPEYLMREKSGKE
ncbi:MAG TPA: sulfatase [Verrucomicrobiae bacterium]|nr:sulfatase [Verrucomicrobiae bacterium]